MTSIGMPPIHEHFFGIFRGNCCLIDFRIILVDPIWLEMEILVQYMLGLVIEVVQMRKK